MALGRSGMEWNELRDPEEREFSAGRWLGGSKNMRRVRFGKSGRRERDEDDSWTRSSVG
jgi:hypothetical protein